MADPAAIRELRRQRILQSGQNRMNKVLGQPQNDNEQDGLVSSDTRPDVNTRSDVHTSQEAAVESQKSSQPEMVLRQRPIIPPETTSNESTHEHPKQNRNTVKVSPIKRSIQTQNDNGSPNESLNSSRSSSDAKMMLKHFEFLRIVMCVMVAYLCRRVLSSGYGIFYFESVILPFACLEASFFLFKHQVLHNVMLPHKSSMLIGVLMLLGIKPIIVQTYNKVMGYFTAAMEDFALFFFAFMMANTFIA